MKRKLLLGSVIGTAIIIFAVGGILMVKNSIFSKLFNPVYVQSEFQNQVHDYILQAVEETPEGETLELARLTPFAWDRVCLFGMGMSSEEINEALQIEWSSGEHRIWEHRQLFVFVKDDKVVHHILFLPELIWDLGKLRMPDVCLSASEAVFSVGGYDWHETRIKKLFLPR
jgi:hypothetical protein